MPKQYERALLEAEAKELLEKTRDELGLSSLSATIFYLIEYLPASKKPKADRP